MKRPFRITYQPFDTATMTCSDKIVYADDEKEAEQIFKEQHPLGPSFVEAKPE
jgi:hypothetical protein